MLLPKILTIAGSDSCAGAGIQADIKAVMAMGGYAATAITAITVQNTQAVKDVMVLPEALVQAQVQAVLEDMPIDVIKTGMLPNVPIMQAVLNIAVLYPDITRVIDPVMVATSGASLIDDEAVTFFREKLIGKADLLTPNIPEATRLTGHTIHGKQDMIDAAYDLQKMGAKHVLLKGGHLEGGKVVDLLLSVDGTIHEYHHDKITTPHTHGTGCSLASAIACLWVKFPIEQAVEKAINYIYDAVVTAPGIGKGHGPINHFGCVR